MTRPSLRVAIMAMVIVAGTIAIIEIAGRIGTHPQDYPWTRLDLDQPIGRFTGAKIAALGENPRRCRALLAQAGSSDRIAEPRLAVPPCGYTDGMRLIREGEAVAYRPAGLVTSCPVAAALAVWERDVVQPAARRRFGRPVATIDHAGSYACRRVDGRADGRFSEHATADAVDVTGFRLGDGRRIGMLDDWHGDPAEAAFLRDIRDGACRLFSTVLSPDYNRAHADHLHFDQATRGALGGRLCR